MMPEYPQSRSKLSAGRQRSTMRVASTIQKWSCASGRARPTASSASSRTRITRRLALALLGVDEPLALRHHLVIPALGDGDVHVHLAVALARDHLGRSAGPLLDARAVEGRRHAVTVE